MVTTGRLGESSWLDRMVAILEQMERWLEELERRDGAAELGSFTMGVR